MATRTSVVSRTPEQVLDDHRAALAAGRVELDVQLNYAPGAVVISDHGVDTGRDAIRRALEGALALLGGAVPEVKSQVVIPVAGGTACMARVLFSVETPRMSVHGVDTYLIQDGQIHAQTAHGSPSLK